MGILPIDDNGPRLGGYQLGIPVLRSKSAVIDRRYKSILRRNDAAL